MYTATIYSGPWLSWHTWPQNGSMKSAVLQITYMWIIEVCAHKVRGAEQWRNPLSTRRCCEVQSTSWTLIERRNNVVSPVGMFCRIWHSVADGHSLPVVSSAQHVWKPHDAPEKYRRLRRRKPNKDRPCPSVVGFPFWPFCPLSLFSHWKLSAADRLNCHFHRIYTFANRGCRVASVCAWKHGI